MTSQHRFLVQLHLQQIDGLDASVGALDREIEANLAPFCIAVDIVSTHPGISKLSAEAIVSEIGAGMSRFATAGLTCARVTTRAPASVGRAGFAKVGAGSRLPSSNAPTPPKTNAEAIIKPNTWVCAADADGKKPSALSRPPFSPPSRLDPHCETCVDT